MPNLALPGNPRYQPKELREIFGYDVLYRGPIEVELAALKTLGEIGIIRPENMALLTPDLEQRLFEISTTEVDIHERQVTNHDIRALVQIMRSRMPAALARWVHAGLTSYDVIDTGRAVTFRLAHYQTIMPTLLKVIKILSTKAREHASTLQIGRTHGQHALPITAGFWLATFLGRILDNAERLDENARQIRGKLSGAVGAYNAQVGLGIAEACGKLTFEKRVLFKLNLEPALVSTQILPPEYIDYYLHSCYMLTASLSQFGRDARQLMRPEIGELREPFEKDQVGSSTMAHKRNPINFESIAGMWKKSLGAIVTVLSTLISEHQRDLEDSGPMRDFPVLLVNLMVQLNTLLRPGKTDPRSFLERIVIDPDLCRRNFALSGDTILAEPMYLALQMAGYEGDAHDVVNQQAMALVKNGTTSSLVGAMELIASKDPEIATVWAAIPPDQKELLCHPEQYTGWAERKTIEVCDAADCFVLA